MYKIFHKLFGWHYVAYRFGYSDYISRLRTSPNGTVMVYLCCDGLIRLKDIGKSAYPLTMTNKEFEELMTDNDTKSIKMKEDIESRVCGNCEFYTNSDLSCCNKSDGAKYWDDSSIEDHWTCHEFKRRKDV